MQIYINGLARLDAKMHICIAHSQCVKSQLNTDLWLTASKGATPVN